MGLLRLFNVIRGLNNGVQDEFIGDNELSDMSNVDIEKGIIKKRAGLVKIGDGIDSDKTTLIDNIYTQSGHLLTVICQNNGKWYQLNRNVLSLFSYIGEKINVVFNKKGVNYNYKYFGILNDMVNGNRPKIQSISTSGFIERIYYFDNTHKEYMGIGILSDDIESMLNLGGEYKGIPFIDNSINIDYTGEKDYTNCRFIYDGTAFIRLYNKFGKYLDKFDIGADDLISLTTVCRNNEPSDINQQTGVTVESDISTDITEVTIYGLNMDNAYTKWTTKLTGTTKVTVGATGIKRIKSITLDGTRGGILKVCKSSDESQILTIDVGITNKIFDSYRKYIIVGKHTAKIIQAWAFDPNTGFSLVASSNISNMGKVRITRVFEQEIAIYDTNNKISFYKFTGSSFAEQNVSITGTTLKDIAGLVDCTPTSIDGLYYGPCLLTLTNASIIAYKGDYYNGRINAYRAHKIISLYAVAYGYKVHSIAAYYKNLISKTLIIYLLANKYANIESFADAGGGKVRVTTTLIHNFSDGESVTITGTIHYNNIYTIQVISDISFDITANWVSNDAKGVANYNVVTILGFDLDSQKIFSERDVCKKDPSIPDYNLMLIKNDNESGIYKS